MQQLRWLNDCMKGKRALFGGAMFLSMLWALLYIGYPFISRIIIDQVLVGTTQADGTVFHNLQMLPTALLLLVGTQVLRSCDFFSMVCILENVSQVMIEKIRLHIYSNLSAQDSAFYDEYRTGDLMTRLTGDMDLVRHTVAWISYNVIGNGSLFIFSMIYFFTINVKLTLVLLAITPILLGATYIYSKSVYPLYAGLREKLSGMNSMAQENISGNKVVRAFAREPHECRKFDECNNSFRAANLKANFQWLKFFPYVEGFSQSLNIIIIVVGGLLIVSGEMTMGDLMAFSLLSWGISAPMREMGVYLNDLQRFFASANKIMEVYHVKSRIRSPKDGRTQDTPLKGDIEFRDVSYHYGRNKNNYALKNINLTIKHGETVAIMGTTGSGKTTLINAIVRMLDVSEGQVLVDGTDVRKWNLHDLRHHIGVATQDVMLYSNSIDANIAYGDPDLPEAEVHQYANLAAAHFVDKLAEGYGTVIGERGTGLSGGQKQRIALARALATKPSVLILDDTTSAVDMETEQEIQHSLDNLPFECTKIIIAQRISSTKNADKIIILSEGAIVECGTHNELMHAGGYYSEVCRLQGALEVNSNGCKK